MFFIARKSNPNNEGEKSVEILGSSLFYMPYLFESAFEEPVQLGYASALSWVLFAVLFALTLITVAVGRRWVHYEN